MLYEAVAMTIVQCDDYALVPCRGLAMSIAMVVPVAASRAAAVPAGAVVAATIPTAVGGPTVAVVVPSVVGLPPSLHAPGHAVGRSIAQMATWRRRLGRARTTPPVRGLDSIQDERELERRRCA